MLETLVTDLDSRGHNTLTVQEDGSIRICPEEDGEEVTQDCVTFRAARIILRYGR